MNSHSLIHLSDQVLLLELGALVARDRANTAALLAHIAEVDARRLYLPDACPSMYEYCVQELGLSEDEALVRIRAGRTGRQNPALFAALADARLSLSAVLLLASYLTRENAAELLAAAGNKTCSELRELLAERFPRPPVPASVEPVPAAPADSEESPACGPGLSLATKRVGTEVSRPRVQPLSPESYALQCTISRETHEKPLYAQALLRHKIPGVRPDSPAFSQDQSNSPRRDLSGECSVHIAPARPNWRLASLIISGAFRRANHSGRKAGLCPDEKFEPERKCTPGKSGNPLRQSINPIFLRSGAHRKSVR